MHLSKCRLTISNAQNTWKPTLIYFGRAYKLEMTHTYSKCTCHIWSDPELLVTDIHRRRKHYFLWGYMHCLKHCFSTTEAMLRQRWPWTTANTHIRTNTTLNLNEQLHVPPGMNLNNNEPTPLVYRNTWVENAPTFIIKLWNYQWRFPLSIWHWTFCTLIAHLQNHWINTNAHITSKTTVYYYKCTWDVRHETRLVQKSRRRSRRKEDALDTWRCSG